MSGYFLCIETSTLNCSVAVFDGEKQLSCVEESSDKYIHGERLHLFIESAVEQAGIALNELCAVAVSKGPGSYTGLRIGVSAAKGLAFSLNIPLYSVDSLAVLAAGVSDQSNLVFAHIDARRMEVYGAFYRNGERLTEISADVVEEDIYTSTHNGEQVILAGDAQEKLLGVLPDNYRASEVTLPSAAHMGGIVFHKIQKEDKEDVAYFEPFYLKDFVAGKPRKSPLNL